MRTKYCWIRMEELIPPDDWVLPFIAEYQGRQYKITGADFVDLFWRGEEI